MPQKNKERIKNREQFEVLLLKGMNREKAVLISNAGREAFCKGVKSPIYEKWNKEELHNKTKEAGVDEYSNMYKKELIEELRQN